MGIVWESGNILQKGKYQFFGGSRDWSGRFGVNNAVPQIRLMGVRFQDLEI